MGMTKRLRGVAPVVAAAILTGALVPVVPAAGRLMLVAVLGLWLATILIGFHSRGGQAWHPVLVLLTGFAVISVTWNGVPPEDAAAPDLFLLAALGALAYCWAQNTVQVPIPGWLVAAAGCLLAAQLIAYLVIPDPPPDQPPSFTPPGPALVTLARVELAMLFVPILIGAVASSWRRASLIADLWVASATISAAIASVDSATGAGIGQSITGFLEEGRTAGLALHANTFALTCAMTVPVALLRSAQLRGWGRAAAIAATGVLLLGILASGSRVGILSAVLAVGFMGLLIAKLRGRILAAGLAAIVALGLVAALAPSGNSLFSSFDRLGGGGSAAGANTQRFDQFRESLDIALDYPVTGVGFQVIADAHSLPVQFWEAAGFLGVFALILYVTGALGTGWRLIRDPSLPKGMSDLAGALTASIAVWLISGLLQNQVADRYIYVPVGVLLGLTLAAAARRSQDQLSRPVPAPPPTMAPAPRPEPVERVPVAH
jgi:O-Antigen ligase